MPQRPPKWGCLWRSDGSCVRLRASRLNHVWCYDFVDTAWREADQLDGRFLGYLSQTQYADAIYWPEGKQGKRRTCLADPESR